MFRIETKGLDALQKQLEDMERRARALDGEHSVSFEELFSPAFMQKYTSHSSFEALLKVGGYEVNSQEDFEAIPDSEWDEHIRKHTRFSSWKEMQEKAAAEWATKKLGF